MSFIYRPAPDWLRKCRTTAIAQSESACKGGASLTGRSSVFFIENSSHEAFEMEETPNFDVLTCSQGSDLGQEQLYEIEQKAQAKSTKKATEWGLKKLASLAPSLRSGANDATRATNKQYARQKSSYCPISNFTGQRK